MSDIKVLQEEFNNFLKKLGNEYEIKKNKIKKKSEEKDLLKWVVYIYAAKHRKYVGEIGWLNKSYEGYIAIPKECIDILNNGKYSKLEIKFSDYKNKIGYFKFDDIIIEGDFLNFNNSFEDVRDELDNVISFNLDDCSPDDTNYILSKENTPNLEKEDEGCFYDFSISISKVKSPKCGIKEDEYTD